MAKRRTPESGAISRARLSKPADPLVVKLSASIDVDVRLAPHDVRGSRAHAKMLAAQGVIPKAEARRLDAALAEVAAEFARGEIAHVPELEDVHTHAERRLQEKIGAAAGRLHTGRSRNDQVALDERLWLRDEAAPSLDAALAELMSALAAQAEAHAATAMPGYTHLQRAQPVTLGHQLLAYVEAFSRDRGRLADCARRANESPLGSGALAATTLKLDREATARELGFSRPTRNSIDAVSARDALLELVSACAIAAATLSRLAEELVLWSTSEFAFVELDDAVCTGSSLMPQKKNPDVPELVRGKAGRVFGDLMALLTLVKGLPLAYNRDLQEDKPPAFDAVDTVRDSLRAMALVVRGAKFRVERLRSALDAGFLLATDLAEALVEGGVPFREAHAIVGRLAEHAARAGVEPDAMTEVERAAFHPLLAKVSLDPLASLARRDVVGGPAPRRVLAEAKRWRKELARAAR